MDKRVEKILLFAILENVGVDLGQFTVNDAAISLQLVLGIL